jgi:two-component system, NarL family, sensor histidine kinase UhpB
MLAMRRLKEMLEEQSKRIAHAVNDEAGELLAVVFNKLDEAARALPPDCGTSFHEIRAMLEQIAEQLRDLPRELRPAILDDLGLVPAMKVLVERAAKRTGIVIHLHSSLLHAQPAAVETTLFRFVQEALTNATRHARAKLVEIRLWEDGRLHCSVRDDGVGFVLEEVLARKGDRGLGLLGIQERVQALSGSLSITSRPGHGTELTVTIPARS